MEQYYFEYNQENGVVYISGVICDEMASKFSEVIDGLLNTQELLLRPQKLVVEINSGGGYATAMFSMVDSILEATQSMIINTHVKGQACSSAFLIWLSGNERTITDNSYVMWHDISYGIYNGTTEEHRENLNQTDVLRKMANDIILEKTNWSRNFLQKIYKSKTNKFIYAKEARTILKGD